MRAEAARLVAAVTLLGGFLWPACRVEAATQDADTTRAASAPADSTRAPFRTPHTSPRAAASTDTTGVSGRPLPTIDLSRLTVEPVPEPPQASRTIDVLGERKLGVASLEDAVRLHRGVILSPLPVSGPAEGPLAMPDGGGPIRLLSSLDPAERATDEHLIGSVAYGWGAPWLAFALDDPRAEAVEALDLDSLRFPLERLSFRGPGDALTRLVPRGPAFAAPGDTTGSGASRTTLVFQRGGGSAQLAGIRLQTTTFRRRLYASYTRSEADGWEPLLAARTSRYNLRVELGRLASHRFEMEGVLHERTIEDSTTVGVEFETTGRSEWDRRQVTLRVSGEGTKVRDSWRFGFGTEKETWILSTDRNLSPQGGSRDLWEFPSPSAEGSLTYKAGSRLTCIATARAMSREILHHVDSLAALDVRRGDARVHVGARLDLAPRAGAGVDAAYDLRQTQTGFWDGRASLWGRAGRARARLDLESAHERPTWIDLLTPASLHQFIAPATSNQSFLLRSGNPALRPRRLSGPLGSASIAPFEGFDLDLTGSYRRVTDDFGWNVSADTTGGPYTVSSVATRRGSGWVSHVALGWELRRGPFRLRGVGWVRSGSDSLAPRAGSPPRRALEAALEWRPVFFKGDLPLRVSVLSHARGPRRGLIRESAQVTWDGSLSADFGSAGVFLSVRDVFDRRPGSAIWDPAFPSGAPTPGRTVQAGIAWNLLD